MKLSRTPSLAGSLKPNNPADGLLSSNEWDQVVGGLLLTPRESEVVRLAFQGMTRQMIAAELVMSPRTVRQHLERIYEKTNVDGRIGLVLRIIRARDACRSNGKPMRP